MMLFTVFCLAYLCRDAGGVPIARAMGCGTGTGLPIEKRVFCCEHFNLDCPPQIDPNDSLRGNHMADETKSASGYTTLHTHKLVQIRTLGERCVQKEDKCAVGLVCKGGFCLRERTKHHLRDLMNRGKLVEQEERGHLDPGTDLEQSDPLPAQKGLILKGQAMKARASELSEDMDAVEVSDELENSQWQPPTGHISNPRQTPTPGRASTLSDVRKIGSPLATKSNPKPIQNVEVHGQAIRASDFSSNDVIEDRQLPRDSFPKTSPSTRDEKKKDRGLPRQKSPQSQDTLMEEEDELAANIADFLTTKLGVSLDFKEMHDIRELIAGTLDERAEREDEVVENIEQNFADIQNANGESTLTAPDTGSMRPTKKIPKTRYEPLSQCNADADSGNAKRKISQRVANLKRKTEGAIHLSL